MDGYADTDEKGVFTILGNRRNADFSDLRWTGLPRSDPDVFPPLLRHSDDPGTFVTPLARRLDLRLHVGAEREGWIVVLADPHEGYAYYPRAYVDCRGEAWFGAVYEGTYKALARRTWREQPMDLGRFTARSGTGRVTSIDLIALRATGERAGK